MLLECFRAPLWYWITNCDTRCEEVRWGGHAPPLFLLPVYSAVNSFALSHAPHHVFITCRKSRGSPRLKLLNARSQIKLPFFLLFISVICHRTRANYHILGLCDPGFGVSITEHLLRLYTFNIVIFLKATVIAIQSLSALKGVLPISHVWLLCVPN